MTGRTRRRTHLATIGAVVMAALAAYVIGGLGSTVAPDRNLDDVMASDFESDQPSLAAGVHPLEGASRTADVEMDDVNCSRVEHIGDRLLVATERREFEQLSSHLPALAVELAADMAGLEPDLRFGHTLPLAARFGVRLPPRYPLPKLATQVLPWSVGDALGQLVDGGDFRAIFDHRALEGQRDATLAHEDSAGHRRTTTVLGAALQRHGATAHGWLPHVPDDWPIGAHDLAVAVEAGVAADVFESLLDRSAGAKLDWQDGFGHEVNLAQLAAYHMRPDLLRALMARGTSPAGKQPLLDDIARLPDVSEHEADVVAILVESGLKIRRPTTLRVLEARYPHQSGLILHSDVAMAVADPKVAELARSLRGAKERWQEARERLEFWREHCHAQFAGDHAGTRTRAGPSEHSTLAAKRRHDEDLREARDQKLEEVRAKLMESQSAGTSEGAPGKLMERAYMAAMDGKWAEAMAAADELLMPFDEMVRRDLLSYALRTGASMEVFEALLAVNGDALPEDAILDLSSRGWPRSARIAEALLVHGLDVHHVDSFGKNAFSRVAAAYLQRESASYREMASFLAARGVSPKPSQRGMDPLDEVLSDMVTLGVDDSGLWLARLLVDIGAPIETSHLELTQRIALLGADGHLRLVQAIPALALPESGK